jgi:ABC-type Mn2+/Zn2+ transport system permease subunit
MNLKTILLIVALIHFLLFGVVILLRYKKEDCASQGIVFSSLFGFGMSFVYLIEALNL